VAGVRRKLERETVTAPAIDAALARADETLGRLAGSDAEPPEPRAPAVPHAWRLGERARSRSGGWEGRVAAIEKGGSRATLEAGGMRVSVSVDDLEPAVGNANAGAAGAGPGSAAGQTGARRGSASHPDAGSGISSLMLERARTVASSLDLRGARVDEALDALGRYLDDASLAGLEQVLIIHGLGTGALRDAVRIQAATHPLVKSFRAGERGEGGDGATIVRL
jgi:DNA mismatch repair protein MutS2